jgi:hypothetical protein
MVAYLEMLFIAGIVFSLMLYLGDRLPWFLSAVGGVFSSLFLFSSGLYWMGNSTLPEMGWLFMLWGVSNLLLSVVVVIGAFKEPEGPFD